MSKSDDYNDDNRIKEEEKLSENSIPYYHTFISTATPEEEIWHYINKLTNYQYVFDLLNRRVKGKDFRKLRQHIMDKLVKSKARYNEGITTSNNDKVKQYQLLRDVQDLKNNAEEITILVKQALEIYKSSQIASIYSKPILLYYSYTKLEGVLFLATYKSVEPTGGHGLYFNANNKSIMCQKDGTFVRFHDSYSWNPSVYLDGCIFRWHDLLLNEETRQPSLIFNMKKANIVRLNEIKSRNANYEEHELTREIIFTYAMSMLARYRVKEWNELIEGKELLNIKGIGPEINIIWKIEEYLKSTQSLFPNLIFNQLHGIQCYFYPSEIEYMSLLRTGAPRRWDWLL